MEKELTAIDAELKDLQAIMDKPTEGNGVITFEKDNVDAEDADDDVIVDIIVKATDIDDELEEEDDDDDDDKDDKRDYDNEILTAKAKKKDLRQAMKTLRKKYKGKAKDKELRAAFKKEKKELKKTLRAGKKEIRKNLRELRKARKEQYRKLHPEQRSAIVNFFRKIVNGIKDTLINFAINGLNKIIGGIKEGNLIYAPMKQLIEFLEKLKESRLGEKNGFAEGSENVDTFVSKVKDAVNNIKINAKETLKILFSKVIEFLKASNQPILKVVGLVLSPFMRVA